MKNSLLLFCLFVSLQVYGQYMPNTNIVARQYGTDLKLPFTGGLTAAQFSDIDINLDGINDLFIFDRGGKSITILIKDVAGNYSYAPEFNHIFPVLEDWALIRDYNCDGLPDIFTYYIGTTQVYKGVEIDGKLQFELAKVQLEYTDGTGSTPLYTSRTDISAIDDIDSDGDIDILAFSVSNATIRFYQNNAVEKGYSCDSLTYELNELCWGSLYEGFSCYGGDLHVACKGGDEVTPENEGSRAHIGSTIVTFDKDGDNDVDAILGDNSCNNLVYYHNGGTVASAEMDYKDTLWQSNGVEYDMTVFPAGYLIDYDNDNDQDFIATTNDYLLGLNTEHIWMYENLNTNDTFDLVFQTDTFLISDMIDIGAYSKPIFFNYNNDNLLDIVAGVSSTFGKSETFHYGLWLFKNIGTAATPKFELVTKNFGNIDGIGLTHLAPAAADADNDGDEDLFLGDINGNITYLENLSGGIGDAVMAAPVPVYQGIDVGQYSTPCFIDIQQDGKLDMVVGEVNGNLNYYHNTGTISSPVFTLESEIWGGVDVRADLAVTGYSTPFMYRNEHDSLYLVSGSQSGNIYLYNEIEDALLGEFYESNTNYYQYHPGTYSSINGADINNDGEMDFITGSIRGGFQIFEKSFGTGISEPEIPELKIYPNPAQQFLTVSLNNPVGDNTILQMYNLTGELIYTQQVIENKTTITLNDGMLPGLYIISVADNDTFITGTFIKL